MVAWLLIVVLLLATGCGDPNAGVGFGESSGGSGGGNSAGSGGSSAEQNDGSLCWESSSGERGCLDPRERYGEWGSYAILDDGRTVELKFTAPEPECVLVKDVQGTVLPTEVHIDLLLLETNKGCAKVERKASVRLSEPVAGRPVYPAVSVGGGGMSTRGYVGAVDGPQCLGSRPAPRAHIDDCPQPANQPPRPLMTAADRQVGKGRTVPWAAAQLTDDPRYLVVQWVSTDCARLAGVKVTNAAQAVVLDVREVPCKGDTVVRATTVDLGQKLGNRRVIDSTYFTP